MSFMKLNTESAKQADASLMSRYLVETGAYSGKFTKAEAITAGTGTKGIHFVFESNDKRTAKFTVYTVKADGTELPGVQLIHALMTCLRIREISEPVATQSTKYDYTKKADVPYVAAMLVDLINKPIGLIMQSCEYQKQINGQYVDDFGWQLECKGAFEAATKLTSGEILSGKSNAETLQIVVDSLKDRPLKKKNTVMSVGGSRLSHVPPPQFDDLDDSIPF